MAPADHRLGGDVIMRDGEDTGIMVPIKPEAPSKSPLGPLAIVTNVGGRAGWPSPLGPCRSAFD